MNTRYKTDDILTASFLLSRGAQFEDIVSDRPRHFIFVFQDVDRCGDLAREYLNDGKAPARDLFARREELMSAMRHRNRDGDRYGDNK